MKKGVVYCTMKQRYGASILTDRQPALRFPAAEEPHPPSAAQRNSRKQKYEEFACARAVEEKARIWHPHDTDVCGEQLTKGVDVDNLAHPAGTAAGTAAGENYTSSPPSSRVIPSSTARIHAVVATHSRKQGPLGNHPAPPPMQHHAATATRYQ